MPRINKTLVDQTAPDPSRYLILWDDRITGFGLQVMPSGTKSYVFEYRTEDGRKKRMTIGKHGKWTADQARKKADELACLVKEGRSPAEEKKAKRHAVTVADLIEAYLASTAFAGKALSTRTTDLGRINWHLRPLLGRLPADTLTAEAVRRAFNDIRDGKTAHQEKTRPRGVAKVTGGEGVARKSLLLLGAILVWARKEGYAVNNPVPDIDKGADGERSEILESAEEYKRLFETLARLESQRQIRPAVAGAIRVLALTGTRKGEIAGLRWRHVDLKAGLIRLSASEHKTGYRTKRDRLIGLPSLAQEAIAAQPPGEPDDYVFAPAKGEGPLDLAKPWALIRAEAGLPETLGLHGLRHSFASQMAMAGAEAAAIRAALGHADLKMSARYIHWAKDKHQALAEEAARGITDAFKAAEGAQGAEVIPLGNKKDII